MKLAEVVFAGRCVRVGGLALAGWLSAVAMAGGAAPAQSVKKLDPSLKQYLTPGGGKAKAAAGVDAAKSSGSETGSATAEAAKPSSPGVENAEAAMRSAEAEAKLQAAIARLPPFKSINIDVAGRSAAVLAHLNAVLRFYRTALTPAQTVGEPSDVLYAEQSQDEATEITVLAFQAAKNESALLDKATGGASNRANGGAEPRESGPDGGNTQRLAATRAEAQGRLAAMQAQQAALASELAGARADQRPALERREEQLQGGMGMQQAIVDALDRIANLSSQGVKTGLEGDIDRLERSAPELLSRPVKTPAPPVLQSLSAARDAGVTTQAGVLFTLLGALHTIDGQIQALDGLSQQAAGLRAPFVKVLRETIAQGQALNDQAAAQGSSPSGTPNPPNPQNPQEERAQYEQLTATFEVLSEAMLPLSQEALLLDNARGTLTTWRATVDVEYHTVLRQLLLRVFLIAACLIVLALANRLLSQAAVKYVDDLRRRRQLLLLRRIVIGFFTGVVLIFGFVTQFSSLATFAGFISAGIAVGLQTILLSIAAYFFIVGRYGIRVGDRITVAGVTGDVIEVGLVRFYMIELVGSGTELHSTGRVAVFANSVLFQTGTPLYKQVPGTEYAWHELTAKLNRGADVKGVSDALLKAVNDVYGSYSDKIETQHQQVEAGMGTVLPRPRVESRLQLVDGGLQFAVLFPVRLSEAVEADERITEAVVEAMGADGPLKAGVPDLPVIKASVKS